jgi:hypothetical protein
MRRFLDTRLARVAKATAPRELTEARQRSLLRARAAVCTLLRERLVSPDAGQALAGAWQLGDAAAAELAGIPDTQDLRETDRALLARDHAGAEETFEARLWHLVQHYRDGHELDTGNASPAELLAACVCRGISASMPPPLPPPHAGEGSGGGGALG